MGEPLGLAGQWEFTMTIWTDERIAVLKQRWPEGDSAERIARALGADVSRNAVLGKVRRLGLSIARPGQQPASEAAAAPPPSGGSATILSVRRRDCRWPYGDPGEAGFRFCGCPVVRGAFCGAHADLAYRKAPGGADDLLRLAASVS